MPAPDATHLAHRQACWAMLWETLLAPLPEAAAQSEAAERAPNALAAGEGDLGDYPTKPL
jgi:hypothetical protein